MPPNHSCVNKKKIHKVLRPSSQCAILKSCIKSLFILLISKVVSFHVSTFARNGPLRFPLTFFFILCCAFSRLPTSHWLKGCQACTLFQMVHYWLVKAELSLIFSGSFDATTFLPFLLLMFISCYCHSVFCLRVMSWSNLKFSINFMLFSLTDKSCMRDLSKVFEKSIFFIWLQILEMLGD